MNGIGFNFHSRSIKIYYDFCLTIILLEAILISWTKSKSKRHY